jgi:hypothetical protein
VSDPWDDQPDAVPAPVVTADPWETPVDDPWVEHPGPILRPVADGPVPAPEQAAPLPASQHDERLDLMAPSVGIPAFAAALFLLGAVTSVVLLRPPAGAPAAVATAIRAVALATLVASLAMAAFAFRDARQALWTRRSNRQRPSGPGRG